MIDLLPTELSLLIIAQLSLHSIAVTQRVCSSWRNFIQNNAEAIYCAASELHGYGRGGQELCRKKRRIERAWLGYGQARLSFYAPSIAAPGEYQPGPVHRFKIDEKNGLIICSHHSSRITVWDLNTSMLLWKLENARGFAHVEYSNGFLVIDNTSGVSLEVWRHEPDFDGPPPLDSPLVSDLHHSTAKRRGAFQLWTILTHPEDPCAFRCIYPTLLSASETDLFLWDVHTGRLTGTIHNYQQGNGWQEDIGALNYVDFNGMYLVVCGGDGMGVYRKPSEGRFEASDCRILLLRSEDYSAEDPAHHDISRDIPRIMEDTPIMPLSLKLGECSPPNFLDGEEFIAAHLDGNAPTLVVLLSHGRLLLIPDLSITPDPMMLSETIQLGPTDSSSRYLAFENGRAVVATTRAIFIIQLPRYSPIDIRHQLSALRVSLVHTLTSRVGLALLSCVQMSESDLWATWWGNTDEQNWIFDDGGGNLPGAISLSRVCRVSCDVERIEDAVSGRQNV